jgi:hypothetical protein
VRAVAELMQAMPWRRRRASATVRCRRCFLSFSALQIVEEAAAPLRVPRRTTFWRTEVASLGKGSMSAPAVRSRLGLCCPFLAAAADWSASAADAVLATSRTFEFDRRRT